MHSTKLLAAIGGLVAAGAAFGQALPTAVLHNGTVVTQKVPLELYALEGTVWDVDIPARTITAMGRTLHVPATIGGATFLSLIHI